MFKQRYINEYMYGSLPNPQCIPKLTNKPLPTKHPTYQPLCFEGRHASRVGMTGEGGGGVGKRGGGSRGRREA